MELFQEIKYENDFEHKNRINLKISNWPRIFDKKKFYSFIVCFAHSQKSSVQPPSRRLANRIL